MNYEKIPSIKSKKEIEEFKKRRNAITKLLREGYFIGKRFFMLDCEYDNFERTIFGGGFVPEGLWYNIGEKALLSYLDDKKMGKYVYEVKINFNNILKISDYEGMINFFDEYKNSSFPFDILPPQADEKAYPINWQKVEEKYDGIEINPYQWILKYSYLWYYWWREAGGCVFFEDEIKKIKLIAKFNKNSEYKFYD